MRGVGGALCLAVAAACATGAAPPAPEPPTPTPTNASVSPPCTCFNLCCRKAAELFAGAMPLEAREGSPWIGYLRAVYGPGLVLPFNLSRLRLLYHNTPEWRARHPGVFWPMDPCVRLPGWHKPVLKSPEVMGMASRFHGLGAASKAEGRRNTCADCSGWLEEGPGRRDFRARFVTYGRVPRSYSVTSLWWRRGDRVGAREGEWVEVYHRRQRPEGLHGYGQWFLPAPGSDIWVNVGRTIAAHNKTAAFHAIAKPWAAQRGLATPPRTPAEAVAAIGDWAVKGVSHWEDVFALMASELGLDSVQSANEFLEDMPDVAYVRRESLAVEGCCPGCPLDRRVRECAPGTRTCPYGVPMRALGGTAPCGCVESETYINCANTSHALPAEPGPRLRLNSSAGLASSDHEGQGLSMTKLC